MANKINVGMRMEWKETSQFGHVTTLQERESLTVATYIPKATQGRENPMIGDDNGTVVCEDMHIDM
jgi:hypothetical protein